MNCWMQEGQTGSAEAPGPSRSRGPSAGSAEEGSEGPLEAGLVSSRWESPVETEAVGMEALAPVTEWQGCRQEPEAAPGAEEKGTEPS